jgi:hypothetical protein
MNTIPVKDLMASQFHGDEFFRYDIVVKYMAIDDLANGGEFGIDVYNRMYTLVRGNKVASRLNIMKAMLEQFETESHPITLGRRNNIRDGSHRLAMACYLDVPEVHYVRTKHRRSGGKTRGQIAKLFSDDELSLIDDHKIKILDKIGIT